MDEIELLINEIVEFGTEFSTEYVVPEGKTAYIYIFKSSLPDSAKAVARLVWDYNGDEQDLWVLHRHGSMPDRDINIKVVGDGVKKLALVCDNACSNDYYFNAFAKVRVS